MLSAFFVYGTLKRGQSNYPLLASYAKSVHSATTRGELRDLGLFPALIDGDGTVRGEVIALDPADLDVALAVIDELEGYDPLDPAGSMYLRRVIAARLDDGTIQEAYAYFYNRDPQGGTPVLSGEWFASAIAVPDTEGSDLAAFTEHVRGFLGRKQGGA